MKLAGPDTGQHISYTVDAPKGVAGCDEGWDKESAEEESTEGREDRAVGEDRKLGRGHRDSRGERGRH